MSDSTVTSHLVACLWYCHRETEKTINIPHETLFTRDLRAYYHMLKAEESTRADVIATAKTGVSELIEAAQAGAIDDPAKALEAAEQYLKAAEMAAREDSADA